MVYLTSGRRHELDEITNGAKRRKLGCIRTAENNLATAFRPFHDPPNVMLDIRGKFVGFIQDDCCKHKVHRDQSKN